MWSWLFHRTPGAETGRYNIRLNAEIGRYILQDSSLCRGQFATGCTTARSGATITGVDTAYLTPPL
ncbi:MAG: hypothetical protein IT367_02170 [Candidatus Hydrogenedentes bacterium]|nr:hypothetical protein [Candidatus Hydrogenedentota bacterium]